jgi:hypothetical protein
MNSVAMVAFIGGLDFNIFFRGLLSVLVGVVVMIGGTYLIVATNSGSRTGGLIAASALFGWMMLMGIVWTAYGIGWVGEAQSWELDEINTGQLEFAEDPNVAELGNALGPENDFFSGVQGEDADQLQVNAKTFADDNADRFSGWEYLITSSSRRGDAQSAAEEFLIDEGVFEAPTDYLPLQFGGFAYGGKPAGEAGDSLPDRFVKKAESILVPWHGEELVAIQVQAVQPQPTLPGQAPPIPTVDENAPVVTAVVARDRGGPIPWIISGTRFVPLAFTIFNAILFAICVYLMHIRDRREMAIRAAAT